MFLLDILFPKRCVSCGRLGAYICSRCIHLLVPIKETDAICPVCEQSAIDGQTHPRCQGRYTPDGLTSFFRYHSIAKHCIRAIKYRFVSDVVGEFVHAIPPTSYNIIRRVIDTHKHLALIPIPLHPSKMRSRGFNQAQVLGIFVAKHLGIPIKAGILIRAKVTDAQVSMKDKKDRVLNMRDAFTVSKNSDIAGRSFVLFDDVFTTGATISAATKELKRAGAAFVWVVTMAR